jgi:hypothetical protein
MKPTNQLVKQLIAKHVELADLTSNLEMTGVRIYLLDRLDLFDMAMDVIGFPPEQSLVLDEGQFKDSGNGSACYNRDKLREEASRLRMRDVDAFIERMYAEYDEYLSKQPHLLAETDEHLS